MSPGRSLAVLIALLGGVLLPAFGVRSTVLTAGILSLAGLAIALAEPFFARRPGPRPATGAARTAARGDRPPGAMRNSLAVLADEP